MKSVKNIAKRGAQKSSNLVKRGGKEKADKEKDVKEKDVTETEDSSEEERENLEEGVKKMEISYPGKGATKETKQTKVSCH